MLVSADAARGGFTIEPYLQSRTDTTVVVRWTTAAADSGMVEYGLTGTYGQTVSHSGMTVDHELTLTGLLLDTMYHYRAISGADTSPDARFPSSAAPPRRFRFLAYSDNHSNDRASHQSVVDRMILSEGSSFAASCGDLTSNGLTTQYGLFFDVESRLLCRLPLVPAVGNHDADSIPTWYRFIVLPGNERWHSFRCGNSAFHFLNDNESVLPDSEQYGWFLNELLSDSADPHVRHVFVFFHLPPYTTSTVYSGNADVREYLCPLFERFKVAVVFSGHVHAYEHSRVNGVHYIITGGGGGTLATAWNDPQQWTVYREATFEFVQVDVAGDTVRTVGIRPEGSEFDALVIANPAGCAESQTVRPRMLSALGAEFGSSRLRLTTTEPATVSALLYDAAGRLVARMAGARLEAGEHTIEWDKRRLTPGVYYGVIRVGASSFFAQLTILSRTL
jgi:acid phosphatase type 7